ncbi:DUF1016 N-terminal domain-containing protein [Massilia antarctica]|uniref:DUF1016 N-terminal domain-containing protein n=1 Tax=Massilia antarctica TaxID=2765360 RepID=UPI0006BC4FA5|nr:DUF1016 N-terminal domain-containing protein [Massilia sp. H27-R4]CUI03820.1 FIG074102: hypothetical protein [Janthinobacterium sp. CG23_2]CUU27606.1 FIG074102: hypothetical protein [Janthinobacterium sp. CG23_2]
MVSEFDIQPSLGLPALPQQDDIVRVVMRNRRPRELDDIRRATLTQYCVAQARSPDVLQVANCRKALRFFSYNRSSARIEVRDNSFQGPTLHTCAHAASLASLRIMFRSLREGRQKMNEQTLLPGEDGNLPALLSELGKLIRQARQSALRAVDTIQVQTCWEVGRHIVEFEQGGAARAVYGKRLLPELAKALTAEFGKGFDVSNLRHMRGFYQAFPIRDAVRRELSWTHYRTLLRVDSDTARAWNVNEAAAQHWSSRALERQIGTLYYERLLASQDRGAVEREASASEDELRAELDRERAQLRQAQRCTIRGDDD